jgi:putative inorganic carbon (HCO3(-)) transporter
MTDNSEPFDYEPLTHQRPRSATFVDEIDNGFAKPASWGAAEPTRRASEPAKPTPELPLNTASETPPAPSSTTATAAPQISILKTGHALSYAGVFLFSLMLYFRPYEWSTSLEWLSSTAFWIAVATVVVFFPTQLGLEGNLTIRPLEVTSVLVLLLFAVLSIPLSLSPASGLASLADFAKVVLIFIVMVNVVRTESRLRWLLLLTFVASAVLSIGALNDYLAGNLSLQGTRISGSFGGIFSNPNDLALHLVTMTPLALALGLGTSNILKKLFYATAALIFVVGIAATFSRGGVLGLIVTIVVMAMKYARRMRFVFVIGVIVLVLGAFAVAPGALKNRLLTTGDASAVSRTDDLKRSIYLSLRHPLLGVGFGNYVFYSNQAKATHNAYTQVASEMGLIAAAFYILFLVAPLKPLLRIERETRDDRKKKNAYYLSLGLQASLIGYMVCSFFASVPYLWYAYYLVAYSIALRRIYDGAKAT